MATRLLLVDNTKLWEVDPSDTQSQWTSRTLPSGLTGANAMTAYAGRILVMNAGARDRLWELDPDGAAGEGTLLSRSMPHLLTGPTGMAAIGNRLFITDAITGNVDDNFVQPSLWELDPDGSSGQGSSRLLPRTLTSPQAMTARNGKLLISDNTTDAIWELDPDGGDREGTILGYTSGNDVILGMTLYNGMIYVADTFSDWILVIGPTNIADRSTVRRFPSGLTTPRGMTALMAAVEGDGFTSGVDEFGDTGPPAGGFTSGIDTFGDPDPAEGNFTSGVDSFGYQEPPSGGFTSGEDSFEAYPDTSRLFLVDASRNLYELDRDGANGEGTLLRSLPAQLQTPTRMVQYQGRLLIVDDNGDELWDIDPDGANTQGTVPRLLPSGLTSPSAMAVLNGRLLMTDTAGRELYELKLDGSIPGETLLRTLTNFPIYNPVPVAMTAYNGRLLIMDDRGALWEIDPDGANNQGTLLRHVVNTAFTPSPPALRRVTGMTVIGGRLFLVDHIYGRLWEIDPDGATTEGTSRIIPAAARAAGPRGLASFQRHSVLLGGFTSRDDSFGQEDPAMGGFTSGEDRFGDPGPPVAGFTSAADSIDGTVTQGAVELTGGFTSRDDSFGAYSQYSTLLVVDEKPLGEGRRELWELDPDGESTQGTKIRDLPYFGYAAMVIYQRRVLAIAVGALYEFKIDEPTPQGTLLRNFPSQLQGPEGLAVINDRLFVADRNGSELWEIDPDSTIRNQGTRVRFFPNALENPFSMTAYEGRLLVIDTTGSELWTIDPAGADTEGSSRTLPATLTSPQGMTVYNGRVLITDRTGSELWQVDPAGANGEGTLLRTLPLTRPAAMTALEIVQLHMGFGSGVDSFGAVSYTHLTLPTICSV